MKDAKHIFSFVAACSEAMIVDRILIRVMPELMKHNQQLTANGIKAAKEILIPSELYTYIRSVAEDLAGRQCVDDESTDTNV